MDFIILESNKWPHRSLPIITYQTGSSRAITIAPATAGSVAGLNMAANTVSVGDNNTNSFSNTFLLQSSTKDSLGSATILYSGSGSTLTLNSGTNFLTNSANTTYTIDGSISGAGQITFAGPTVINNAGATISSSGNQTYNGAVTLGSDAVLTSSGLMKFASTGSVNDTTSAGAHSFNTYWYILKNSLVGNTLELKFITRGSGNKV